MRNTLILIMLGIIYYQLSNDAVIFSSGIEKGQSKCYQLINKIIVKEAIK